MKAVAIGGTLSGESTPDRILREVSSRLEIRGCAVTSLYGSALDLPLYSPGEGASTDKARVLVTAVRKCDILVLASPVYHGAISGVVKNALDYLEELRSDDRPYLSSRVVGVISTGAGWQGAAGTLVALRSIVHALRGWPSPMGLAINTTTPNFIGKGGAANEQLSAKLDILCDELTAFAGTYSVPRNAACLGGKVQD